MTCATCMHAETAPRYPEPMRHCRLNPYALPTIKAWAGVRCPPIFDPPRWERKA